MTRQDVTPITRRSADHARWSSGADGRDRAQGYRLIPSKHDHHRPHLLIVRMDVKGKPTPSVAKTHFERLAVRLGAPGHYAFKVEGTTIYAAFEDDTDAVRFAAVLRPMQPTREPEGASKALARVDDAAYRRIAAVLKTARRATSAGRVDDQLAICLFA